MPRRIYVLMMYVEIMPRAPSPRREKFSILAQKKNGIQLSKQ